MPYRRGLRRRVDCARRFPRRSRRRVSAPPPAQPLALKLLRPELAHALGPERFLREIRNGDRREGAGIWEHFYGLSFPHALGYLFGVAEIAIATCLFLGAFRTVASG